MDTSEKRKLDNEAGHDEPSTKKRVIGPAMPPPQAASNPRDDGDRAPASESNSDSDSDDDFGPVVTTHASSQKSETQTKDTQRDEWMLQPPSSSDWASKIDPTQLRNRKFQTGKSARAPGSKQLDAAWVESPEERMRRLQDQVMGVGPAPNRPEQRPSTTKDAARAKEMEDRIKQYNEIKGKNVPLDKERMSRKEEEDDPSARAFDREKDMALGSKITGKQRREIVSKASDYGSRFSKGNYL
ncbi:hypothetical protein N7539_002200 [Penicillium diatomitis]|uniref:DUF3752 domain-containing protein n=1 Tax=Penicillium diatomitis TaxID=2819901 RepID=A0A9W9XID3_9EURO|nr:uncharacterized protein N7539_002200 [Penicillium diatomitis]KAJ5493454.1 hypothetical protein N7539_002200 [Penicillium diatomitis]